MVYLLNILVAYLVSQITLSVLPNLRIFGAYPLLPLFLIILLAYHRKGAEPLLIAAFIGIYFDIFSSYPFGFYTFFFLGAVYIVRYMFQEGMRTLSFWHYLVISAASVAIFYTAQLIFLYFEGAGFSLGAVRPVIAGLAINILCAILLYAPAEWYFEKIHSLEQKLKRR